MSSSNPPPLHGNRDEMESETKSWGKRQFWGVAFDYDPQWFLDEDQKQIQRRLIELCRTTLRPNALISDKQYEYPFRNMKALASQGLLGLVIPKEFGGLGQNHVCATMVVETIARYGCPSTAMVYVMHYTALSALLLRHHSNSRIQELLRRVSKETLIGTISYSDPATGGHFWYPMSSRTQMTPDGKIQLLKYGSWATSAGFADFYVIVTVSPEFEGNFSNLSCFLLFKDDVRPSSKDWSALGMHGTQSGPVICEATVTQEQLVGPFGDGQVSIDEVGSPRFLLLTSACWNGIAMGSIDIARKHVTSKEHADIGMRIADYPTIQDYFGQAMCGTNASRLMAFSVAQHMDTITRNADWTMYSDHSSELRIGKLRQWCWQLKFVAAKNVNMATDKMMQACGGAGYKEDLGVERLLRDGRAGWLMGPSNEVLMQFVGTTVLFGQRSLDTWSQRPNKRKLNAELRKLDVEEKMNVAHQLMREAALNKPITNDHLTTYQDTDFDNPFNTNPPTSRGRFIDEDGVDHQPALSVDQFVQLKLMSVKPLGKKQAEFQFALPQPSQHTGCLPGQYVQVRLPTDNTGRYCQRYFSPVNSTKDYGRIDIALRFESRGQLSQMFQCLKPGDMVEFRGPCGGLEYKPNTIKHLSLVASGSGVTPCIQMVREVMSDPADSTFITMLYHAECEAELLFKSELDGYDACDDRFHVFYTVSEGAEEGNWEGGEGHFNMDTIQHNLPGPDINGHKIVLCGGPGMVVSFLHLLFESAYHSQHIFVYGPFGVEQVRAVYGRNAQLSSHLLQGPIEHI